MGSLLGVNLPYFAGAYGHDLAPSARHPGWPIEADAMAIYRGLLEARALGLEAVRVWLCEGAEGLVLDDAARVRGVHPRLLDSIRILEEGAERAGVRVYWTLLDANSAARDGDEITRSILAERDQAARFAEHIVAPIARRLDPKVGVGLEIVNEPEVVTPSCADARGAGSESIAWSRIGETIAECRRAALAERGELLITAGTGHVFLPELWRSGAAPSAIDVHVYHREGGLPSKDDLARYVGEDAIRTLPLIAGECGIPKEDDPRALVHYLWNAEAAGYDAVFLWKLEGDLIDAKSPERFVTELGKWVRGECLARAARA